MYIVNIKAVSRQIERKMLFLPEYFYCQHPADKAPIRILISSYRNWKRGVLRRELQSRGYVVNYWKAKFKGFG
jgi:hypothetical protein